MGCRGDLGVEDLEVGDLRVGDLGVQGLGVGDLGVRDLGVSLSHQTPVPTGPELQGLIYNKCMLSSGKENLEGV